MLKPGTLSPGPHRWSDCTVPELELVPSWESQASVTVDSPAQDWRQRKEVEEHGSGPWGLRVSRALKSGVQSETEQLALEAVDPRAESCE